MKHLVKKAPTDVVAAILGAILTILSALGVPEKLGVTAEDLGMILGALATVAASVRAKYVAGARAAESAPPSRVDMKPPAGGDGDG